MSISFHNALYGQKFENSEAWITGDEKSELLFHLVTDTELFQLAEESSLRCEDFGSNGWMQAVWNAARELKCDSNATAPFSTEALRSRASFWLENDQHLLEDHCLELFGSQLPQWVKKKFPKLEILELGPGFFDRLAAFREEQPDPQRGRQLLQRLLMVRTTNEAREALSFHHKPRTLTPFIEELQRRQNAIQSITESAITPIGDQWESHEEWLTQFRGRELIGLKTGMPELDRRTRGLRGLTLLGAGPGVGKTTYAMSLGLGICQHHADNDAIVVFASLEMEPETIISRIKCNLADMNYATLMSGSLSRREQISQDLDQGLARNEICWFDETDRECLERMGRRYREHQIDRRFTIVGRHDLGEHDFTGQLSRVVAQAKQTAGASRAMVVIDYLQVIPVPLEIEKQGDLSADRYRVACVQELLEAIQTGPLPDGVLVISEARKPSSAKEQWGQGLAELMGSARLGYAADAVLLYSGMDDKQFLHYYDVPKEAVEGRRRSLEERSVAPVELTLVKGRDGTIRGSWGVEYSYHRNRFRELDQEPDSEPIESVVCANLANATSAEVNGTDRHHRTKRKVASKGAKGKRRKKRSRK